MKPIRSGSGGHGHIDRSTGRNKRDDTRRDTHGGPKRWGGKIVPKGRLARQRDRRTGGK
jgi:hypothetical protein